MQHVSKPNALETGSEPDNLNLSNARFAKNIDWNLFKVFHEICRQGGIGAAARSLNKQQPSVSAALQRLEEFLGAPLCTRTNRGIKLTVTGHQIMAACEAIYEQVQASSRVQSFDAAEIAGSLSLRVISNLYLIPKLTSIFETFHQRHPKIDVRLDVAPWRSVLHTLRSGEVELAIGFADNAASDIALIPIIEQDQQVYCGPQHPLFGKDPVSPDALAGDAFVITQDEPASYVEFRQKHMLGRHIGGVADNLQERMWLIQLGMGVGLLPVPIAQASSLSAVLWPMLKPSETPKLTLYLMTKENSIRSAPAQLFLDVALSHLKS